MSLIKSIHGKVLFEHKSDSLKKALIEAVKNDANLPYAYLSGANLSGANLPDFLIVPESGSFIAYKKLSQGYIAEIQIPAKAKRISSITGRKCRAEYVKTLHIWDKEGKETKEAISGGHDNETIYQVGKITRADKFDNDIRIECSNGIHFFITRKEAEEY